MLRTVGLLSQSSTAPVSMKLKRRKKMNEIAPKNFTRRCKSQKCQHQVSKQMK